LGVLFIYKGDGKRLSRTDVSFFFITALIMASFSVSDHVAIPQVGWYAHMLVSSVVMCLMCLFYKDARTGFRIVFSDKKIVYAGIAYTMSEFLCIYASINILPVSIVAVFLRLSVPVVMIISAIKYKEQSVKNQLSFSLIAILLALPIILMK